MVHQEAFNAIIIDDDPINNLLTTKIIQLDFPKAEVITFLDPQAGLDYIYALPDQNKTLLLLDINMPKLSGWDVLEILDGYPDSIKGRLDIYMFTSSISLEDKQKAKDNPLVLGFIEKPLSSLQLEIYFKKDVDWKDIQRNSAVSYMNH